LTITVIYKDEIVYVGHKNTIISIAIIGKYCYNISNFKLKGILNL